MTSFGHHTTMKPIRQFTVLHYFGHNVLPCYEPDDQGRLQPASSALRYLQDLPDLLHGHSEVSVVAMGFIGPRCKMARLEFDDQGVRDTTDGLRGSCRGDTCSLDRIEATTGSAVEACLPETLKNFVVDAIQQYPARHYVLHIHSHGHGIEGLKMERGRLSLQDFQSALSQARRETGRTLDLLVLEACQQSHLEVLSALHNEGLHIMASACDLAHQGVGEGRLGSLQVQELVRGAVENPGQTAEELSGRFLARSVELGRRQDPPSNVNPTLAVADTGQFEWIENELDRLGRSLMPSENADRVQWLQAIKERLQGLRSMPEMAPGVVDLGDLVKCLGSPEQVRAVEQARDALIPWSFNGVRQEPGAKPIDYTDFGPMAVYFPLLEPKLQSRLQDSAGHHLDWCGKLENNRTRDLLERQLLYRRGQQRGLGTSALQPVIDDLRKVRDFSEDCITGKVDPFLDLWGVELDTETCKSSLRQYLTPEWMEQAGIREIWKDEARRRHPYFQAPHQPQGWKDFVALVWEVEADQAWDQARAILENQVSEESTHHSPPSGSPQA